MKPELIFYGGHNLTESPLLDEKNGLMYFLAIRYNTIFELNIKTLEINSFVTDGPVGGIAFSGNKFIEAEKNGIYSIDFKNGTKNKIAHIITYNKMRYNHIISDSKGRLLVDVIGDEDRCEGKGGLYSLDKDKAECLICGTTVANGVCLNKNETKLYFTDTPAQRVWSYDYDCESGTVSNKKEIAKFFGNPKPDGLALDDSGFLYITEWAGGKIDIFDTVSNKKADEILFPCKRITACCINNDTLYATTAKCGDADEIPYAGGVFVVKIK